MFQLKLLYRGEKYIDESFPDYLMRLAYWNGYGNLRTFSKRLKEIYREQYVDTSLGETVEGNLSGLNVSYRDLSLFECKYALEMILKRNFCSEEMNLSSQTRGKKLHQVDICRACWKERPYVRFYWRFYSYEVCHKHETELESIEMTSYHPKDERIGLLEKSSIKVALNSYWTIRKFLEITENTGCSLKDLSREAANLLDETRLWPQVVSFLETRFWITFQFDRVDELLDVDILCGLDPLKRLELVAGILVDKSDANEKLVKITSLIFLSKLRLYEYRVAGFNSWARAQAYSISPLFEVYMFGVGVNLFYRNSSSNREVIGPVFFLIFPIG